ncbi:MAG: flagellar hook-associated protein FlgL [Nitrosomonas sp.]|nr:flagellar hook-associated protein FlgL [Nitrosomonas sp.]
MIRVSTNTIHDKAVTAILQQQEKLLNVQQQVSTGRRILTPADDPVAAARALEITQADALNTQYSENRNIASTNLGLVESTLDGVTKLIQNVQTATVNAGNATFTDSDRQSIVTELRGRFEELMGFANTTDATGRYLFSGYKGDTLPFVKTATGVVYNGDQGERKVQIGASRQVSTGESGTDVFERIKNGNGVFVTAANSLNVGTGVIDVGSVTAPASLTGNNYEITFTVTPLPIKTTTYEIVNTTTAAVVSTGNPYTSGDSITFDGLQFSINGEPSDTDKFTVTASSNESIFKTIDDLINVLLQPTTGQPGGTRLINGLNTAFQNLENGLNQVLTTRASVGSRLQEVDMLQNVGEDSAIQFRQNLSDLQDVDYAKAISDLNQQQVFLEAAQKSYVTVTSLSLFDFI